jgi:hypothetical protein
VQLVCYRLVRRQGVTERDIVTMCNGCVADQSCHYAMACHARRYGCSGYLQRHRRGRVRRARGAGRTLQRRVCLQAVRSRNSGMLRSAGMPRSSTRTGLVRSVATSDGAIDGTASALAKRSAAVLLFRRKSSAASTVAGSGSVGSGSGRTGLSSGSATAVGRPAPLFEGLPPWYTVGVPVRGQYGRFLGLYCPLAGTRS